MLADQPVLENSRLLGGEALEEAIRDHLEVPYQFRMRRLRTSYGLFSPDDQEGRAYRKQKATLGNVFLPPEEKERGFYIKRKVAVDESKEVVIERFQARNYYCAGERGDEAFLRADSYAADPEKVITEDIRSTKWTE